MLSTPWNCNHSSPSPAGYTLCNSYCFHGWGLIFLSTLAALVISITILQQGCRRPAGSSLTDRYLKPFCGSGLVKHFPGRPVGVGDPWDPGSVTCRGAGLALGSGWGRSSLQVTLPCGAWGRGSARFPMELKFMAAQGLFKATGQPRSAGMCLS